MSASTPAPGELEVVRAFVNTWDADTGVDAFATPGALRDWLRAHGLLPAAARVTRAETQRARAVREALRSLLRANHGGVPLDPGAGATLEAAARRARLAVRFGPDGRARPEALAHGTDGAVGALLARVAAAMDDGTWARLKVCPADDCQWAFYDASRNRSAVWCDMAVCGNRQKVRAHRARQAAGALRPQPEPRPRR